MANRRVAIVGGGLGGLAAAVTLAARGHRVTLLERNAWPGGKAVAMTVAGFRFDLGPTILTLPSVLARVAREAGRRLDEVLELTRLDPQWRGFYEGGTTLDLVADTETMADHLEQRMRGGGEGYRRFMALSKRLHDLSERYYFWKPIGGLGDMFKLRESLRPGTLRDVLDIRPGRSVAATVRACVRDPQAAQMFDHFTQYVGSAPDASPAVLCGIAHMQTSEGVWYPRGGLAAVATALAHLARDVGVEIRTNAGVAALQIDAGHVRGVRLESGEVLTADAVVSNADSVRTHRELIAGTIGRRFERRRRYEPACSGVVLLLGLDQRYDHLAHHNFVFSRDPQEEFDSIYRRGEPAADPTCYVCAPAMTESAVAPTGGEALYILVHTPYLRPNHRWSEMLPAYRRVILDKLARVAGLTDLEARIRVERCLTPQDIHDRYGVLNGAIYGLASHGTFRGAFKPSNRSPDVAGLYLAGGSAHPGPGVPMAVMSGWIAADALDRDAA